MTSCAVVVLGHVDHGKSALVEALTGTRTDRLPEERARGLSIVPGFAHCACDAGIVDLIDAPGHRDFIRAVVAGASGAAAAVLVVSAVDGLRAQTLEHLAISGFLGLIPAFVAVTQIDRIAPRDRRACLARIAGALAGTGFAQVPRIACSAVTGEGLGDVRAALCGLLRRPPPDRALPPGAFLPVDRAFALPGRGTVVTGTLLGAPLAQGDRLVLHPGGHAAPVRELHSRGEPCAQVAPGARVAVNLRGVALGDVARGAVLHAPGAVRPGRCVDVWLRLGPGPDSALRHMDRLWVMFGATGAVAQVRLLGGGQMAAGGSGPAQLRFETAVVAYSGQHAVLRRLSPAATIGGAVIRDPEATPARAGDTERAALLRAAETGDAGRIAAALIDAGRGIADRAHLARLIPGLPNALPRGYVVVQGDRFVSGDALAACRADLCARLQTAHDLAPLKPLVPRAALHDRTWPAPLWRAAEADLIRDARVRAADAGLALAGHDPDARITPAQRARQHAMARALLEGGLAPPTPKELCADETDTDLLALLIAGGTAVALRNVALNRTLVFHHETLNTAARTLRTAFARPFTTGEARGALATTRRVIVPVLEHLDARGLTERSGDLRRWAGPR
ncbi:MAG: SelB C-terminal domain-containing protein [Rhodobacteraceae bacterium]|nr:SelB C-terminal domain-containing protein [Paracoccaceae bacterium]